MVPPRASRMFVTIVTIHPSKTQIHQFDAPTVKDCLVAWAGKIAVEGQTDEGRTRLRGDMADFDRPTAEGFGNLWRFESNLGLEGPGAATVIVVETVKHAETRDSPTP